MVSAPIRNRETSVNDLKGKIDFGIITIREDEFEAVLQRLPAQQLVTGRQGYAISRLQTANGDEYMIAIARCIEPGNGQGQLVARDLIDDLDPQWLFLVGIAGSVPDYEYTLGDVILATRLHDFSISASLEDQKERTSQQFSTRGGGMHPEVQKWLSLLPALPSFLEPWNTPEALTVPRPQVKFAKGNFYGSEQWKKTVRARLNRYFGKNSVRKKPKAFAGSVASSDVLLKNSKMAGQWLNTARDLKAVEMELAGVYLAASHAHKPVLAIRGISDVVGFKRSPDWTTYACHTAASFLAALLRFRPINPLSVQEASAPEPKEVPRDEADLTQNHPVSVFIQQPPRVPPIEKTETIYANLLEVSYFPEYMYTVQTDCTRPGQVWGLLRDATDDPPGDWVLKGNTLYSFQDFSDQIWENVCDVNTVEEHPTSHWSESRDQNRKAEFIELLRNCLKEWAKYAGLKYIYKQRVGREKRKFKYLCFPPTPDLSDKVVVAKSLVQSREKRVFGAHYSKDGQKLLYYRHHALRFEFVRYDDQWYVELGPTFHYTHNGYRVPYYYEDLIKKIRGMQKNNAVFLLVVFWARVLQYQTSDSDDLPEYPYLKFGELLNYPFQYGVKDELWMNKEPIEKEEKPPARRRTRGPTRGGRRGR